MKISEKFEEEVCSKCDDRTFCKRDMLQLHACATVEIWNLLMEKQDNVNESSEKILIYVSRKMLKMNAINLAKWHREHCNDKNCNISLGYLKDLLLIAGIEITQEERMAFV